MKKIISLGLAAAMMSTTALASQLDPAKYNVKNYEPGTQIQLPMKAFVDRTELFVMTTARIHDSRIVPAQYSIGTKGPQKINGNGGVGQGGTVRITAYYKSEDGKGEVPHMNTLGFPWQESHYGQPHKKGQNKGYLDWQKTDFGLFIGFDDGNGNIQIIPGVDTSKLAIDKLARQNIDKVQFTRENFNLVVKFSKGQNLVKSYEFDGLGNIVITLKDNFKTANKTGADLVPEEISVTSKTDVKSLGDINDIALHKNRKFVYDPAKNDDVLAVKTIDGKTNIITVGVDGSDPVTLTAGNTETLDGSGEWTSFQGGDGTYSAPVKFEDPSAGITVQGMVYSGDTVKFKYDPVPTPAAIRVFENNPTADIHTHTFDARGFKTGFAVSISANGILGANADNKGNIEVLSGMNNMGKVYTMSSTGVLTAAPFVYNPTTGTFDGRLPANGGTLLVSNMPLKGVANTTPEQNTKPKNPSTGSVIDLSFAVIK